MKKSPAQDASKNSQCNKDTKKKTKLKVILEAIFKSFFSKLMMAVLTLSICSKIRIGNFSVENNKFAKILIGILGYLGLGNLFIKFEEFLEKTIDKLLGIKESKAEAKDEFSTKKVLLSSLSQTIGIMLLSIIGFSKKAYFVHESFTDENMRKFLNFGTDISQPFYRGAVKAGLNINSFEGMDNKNVLNSFHNLGEWLHTLSKQAKEKNKHMLAFGSGLTGYIVKNVWGWPNWREASIKGINPTAPEILKDIGLKCTFPATILSISFITQIFILLLNKVFQPHSHEDKGQKS